MKTTSKKVLTALRRWKRANPEKVAQQKVRWQARHPNYMRDWRRRNPDKIKDYRKSA